MRKIYSFYLDEREYTMESTNLSVGDVSGDILGGFFS